MNFNVSTIPNFEREIKSLVKKFPSLKKEYENLIDILEKNPFEGRRLFGGCYKIRLAIASKGKGKSGGARIITHVKVVKQTVYLLSIYDKSEQEDISDDVLKALIKAIPIK